MMNFKDIRDVHLEISSLCNASCPWCPRNFWGYPYNGGYPETNMTLDQARKIFNIEFLKQLKSLRINGNFGDAVMNPETVKIVEYFKECNPTLNILISTNGSARNADFWQGLARAGITVSFALDGLKDTHHLYRQNTSWDQVIKNATTFIQAGGNAWWQMIRFDHNKHQIDECRILSQKLGFDQFNLITNARDAAPVFNKHGELTHTLGNYTGEKEFKILFHSKKADTILLEDIINNRTPSASIDCEVLKLKSIYVAANGDVSPCCFTGFYPKTYGHGQYLQPVNAQLIPLITKNNALEYPLADCIAWFTEVKKSWNIDTFENGRLIICNDVCGKSNK